MAGRWHVVAQNPTERYMGAIGFRDVVEVTVEHIDGTTNTIIVPKERYTPEYVTAEADAWADQHDAVASL